MHIHRKKFELFLVKLFNILNFQTLKDSVRSLIKYQSRPKVFHYGKNPQMYVVQCFQF